jgi:hypothetical protein
VVSYGALWLIFGCYSVYSGYAGIYRVSRHESLRAKRGHNVVICMVNVDSKVTLLSPVVFRIMAFL